MLWLCVVALAAAGIKGAPLLVLSGIGLLGTAALLPGAHRRQVTRLRGLAATDALTGLTNHRGFQEVLAAELERARRGDRPIVPGDDGPRQLQDGERHSRAPVRG